MNDIEALSIELVDTRLIGRIVANDLSSTKREFAFYILRNEERIHIEWYSERSAVEFDTEGIPGYYRIIGFMRTDGTPMGSLKSAPIFANFVEVSPFDLAENDQEIAYLLKGDFWNFPALYHPNDQSSLFVMLPSAVNRTKTLLPAFSRWTWAMKGVFPGHTLCIADPTLQLHDDLRLGWCIGRKTHCATTELARFVKEFADAKRIAPEKIVFYGSSAGGFAALALSALVEGSIAVAINAQTDALSYEMREQVALVCQECFENMPEDAVRREFADRVNMASRWGKVDQSKAFLVQNELDTHHYYIHFAPFWNALGGGDLAEGITSSGRHTAWVYRQEGGHIPETVEMAQTIVSRLQI